MREKNSISPSEKKMPRIGVDLTGCDTPQKNLLRPLLEAFEEFRFSVALTLFGTGDLFSEVSCPKEISCMALSEIIGMDENPLSAIRRKKNSSLCVGMRLLEQKQIDAFISAGNTGALIASAKTTLPMLPKIDRPALLAMLPTRSKEVAVLDVGANVSCKGEHLLQFASMGIAYQKSRGIASPVVGLLNIGSEERKGTPELREAYQRLQVLNQRSPKGTAIFMGNIEGRDVFHAEIDVLVTDGFTGNIFLKTSEGVASFILEELQKTMPDSSFESLLSSLHQRLHYAEYPGAILCGVEGIVVKCHGEPSPQSFLKSIKETAKLIQNCFLDRIKSELLFDF